MYAIVETAGRQYKVSVGEVLYTEKLKGYAVGDKVTFERVVYLKTDDGKTLVGQPYLMNVKVTGTVLEHARARKILVGQFIPRKGHKTVKGHRQWYTAIKVESIELAAEE